MSRPGPVRIVVAVFLVGLLGAVWGGTFSGNGPLDGVFIIVGPILIGFLLGTWWVMLIGVVPPLASSFVEPQGGIGVPPIWLIALMLFAPLTAGLSAIGVGARKAVARLVDASRDSSSEALGRRGRRLG